MRKAVGRLGAPMSGTEKQQVLKQVVPNGTGNQNMLLGEVMLQRRDILVALTMIVVAKIRLRHVKGNLQDLTQRWPDDRGADGSSSPITRHPHLNP